MTLYTIVHTTLIHTGNLIDIHSTFAVGIKKCECAITPQSYPKHSCQVISDEVKHSPPSPVRCTYLNNHERIHGWPSCSIYLMKLDPLDLKWTATFTTITYICRGFSPGCEMGGVVLNMHCRDVASWSLFHTYRHRDTPKFGPFKVLTLCQWLTGRMGLGPIKPD